MHCFLNNKINVITVHYFQEMQLVYKACSMHIPYIEKNEIYLNFVYFAFYGQEYFTYLDRSQLLGMAKLGDPLKQPPDHAQTELGLSPI